MHPRTLSMGLCTLILTGCETTASLFHGPEWQPDAAFSAPPGALTLEAGELAPGYPTDIQVLGAEPGETVRFLLGRDGAGEGPCPPAAGGLCLDTGRSTVQLGAETADDSGTAHAELTLPVSVAPGREMALQALVVRGPGGADSLATDVLTRTVHEVRTLDDATPGDLVTTEIMNNPDAVGDSSGEWFEIRNDAAWGLELFGLEIGDAFGTAFTFGGPTWLAPGGLLVLGAQDDPALNGGVQDVWQWPAFTLANTSDSIVLSYDGVVLHDVAWDDGATFPDPVGASMSHDPSAVDWHGSTWCEGVDPFGDGDLGTPGQPNPACPAPVETCDDGILNQDEEDVDCGGGCEPCAEPSPSDADEHFESGDLTAFPWVATGATPWTIEDDATSCFDGDFCARTSPYHDLGDTSELALSLPIREDGEVAFQALLDTEADEHFLRFYIDDELMLETSGVTGWQRHAFAVSATGPGEEREFRWEYSRSTYLPGDHAPRNTVWLDAIELPAFNHQPDVPTLLAPGPDAVHGVSPTLSWTSTDLDGDTITYLLEADTDPAFSAPLTSGETFDTSADLGLGEGTWFWRVKAKDDQSYVYSAYSEVRTLVVDSAWTGEAAWRQSTAEQFATGTYDSSRLRVDDTGVTADLRTYDSTTAGLYLDDYPDHSGYLYQYPWLTDVAPGTTGTLTFGFRGNHDDYNEYFSYKFEGEYLQHDWIPGVCGYGSDVTVYDDVSELVADGELELYVIVWGDESDEECSTSFRYDFRFQYADSFGSITSTPIHFADHGAATVWDHVQWDGTDGITVQVLDGAGTLLPEDVLPGNADGFTEHTIHLFGVDPVAYPALQLQAHLPNYAQLTSWSVITGDAFTWTFEQAGDAQGWFAEDPDGVPWITVADGVLRFESTAEGTDPNLQLWFPAAVEAGRFSEIEVRVRTSNNAFDDVPTLFWYSDFGPFDDRRSVVHDPIYLLEYRDLVFDLTQVPIAPGEPWQGWIDALRLDLVDAFVDAAGLPSDGWLEIERIALR